jgi:hypothetical protein
VNSWSVPSMITGRRIKVVLAAEDPNLVITAIDLDR